MFDLQLDHNFSSHLELDKIFVASTITNIELGPGPSSKTSSTFNRELSVMQQFYKNI